jgi:hypothetical protein
MMPTGLEGRCLCAAVRLRATRAPLRTLACHCTFCQRLTGTAFHVESIFAAAAVEFDGAELRTWEHVSDTSGKKVFVQFCPRCGTTVGLAFERWADLRAVSRSCFDDPGTLGIDAHIWTRSAQPGVVLPAGVDCFEQARYLADGRPAVPVRHAAPVMATAAGAAAATR